MPWLEGLPRNVERLGHEWSLVVGERYEPGGGTSWTAPVMRRSDGERLVLKIGWRDTECLHEPEGLRAWDGDGTVQLHRTWRNEETSALLLERMRAGNRSSQRAA
ncbi:MAG: hypothetical protein WD646_02580 [Actinomycetota bacterium]